MGTETANLHLSLGPDSDTNANWEKLDWAMDKLARGTLVPGPLQVEGPLRAASDVTVDGVLKAGGIGTPTLTTDQLTATGKLTSHGGLTVADGPVILPEGSLNGLCLLPNAAVHGVWVSQAITTSVALTPTARQITFLNLDPTEDPQRWEILFAQATLHLVLGPRQRTVATFELRRGDRTLQTRTLNYGGAMMGAVESFDVPFTLLRIAKPMTSTPVYSLWGADPGGCHITFAQLYCLQLR